MSSRKPARRPERRRTRGDVEPSRDELERRLKSELCRVPDRVQSIFDSYFQGNGLRAVEGYEFLLAYLASWTLFIQKGVGATLQLQVNGFSNQAAPIRRNLLEHAITCFVVADEPGSFDALLRAHQQSARKALNAARRAGVETDEESIQAVLDWEIDESTLSLSNLAQTKAKFEKFGEAGDRLYLAWLEETGLSHANPSTAGLHLRPTPGDDFPTLVVDPTFEREDWFVASQCADSLLLALQSLSSITEGDPLASEIEKLHEYRNGLIDELGSLGR